LVFWAIRRGCRRIEIDCFYGLINPHWWIACLNPTIANPNLWLVYPDSLFLPLFFFYHRTSSRS
jgi:hypothetical protein